jgi:hypothetical protein
MQLPLAGVVLPHDEVLALVSNGVTGSKKLVSANFNRRLAMGLQLNRFQARTLEAHVDHALPNVRMAAVPRTKSLCAGSN